MALVSGKLSTITGDPSRVTGVKIKADRIRPSTTGVTTAENEDAEWNPGTGDLSFDAEPGDATIILTSGRSVDSIPISVPDVPTATLEEVVSTRFVIPPAATNRALETIKDAVAAEVDAIKWLKGTATELGITSADNAPEGIVSYFASHATAWGLPRSGAGAIQTVGGNQAIWVQEDGIAETWQRAYAGGVWREWRQVSNNVVQFGSAGFTSVDDLPTGSTVGFFASQSQDQGLPLAGAMTVMTLGGFQLALGVSSGRNEVWMRARFSSGWNDWVMLNDRWARHNLTAGADLFTVPYDTYGVNTSALAESLGLPVRAIGTLEVMPMNAAGNLRTLRFTTWNQSDTQVWVCSQRNVGEFGAWHRIDEGANVALAHETVDAEARQIAGSPLVHGTAVALVFDHGTNVFQEQLLPLLRARNIPATISLNSQMYNPAEVTRWEHDNRTTWAMVKSWWDNDGIEIANHGRTHKTITGDKELFHEIVGSLEELKANLPGVPITSWVQHAGVPAVTSHADYTDRVDGRYIYANHAAMTSAIVPQRWPLSGSPRLGMSRFWIDNPASITSTKNLILGTPVGWGTMVSGHPEEWGKQGNSTISDIEGFLDWLVEQRDAGRITLLTMREIAYARPADADLGQRIDSVEWWGGQLGSTTDLDTLKTTNTYVQRYAQSAAEVEALHYPAGSAGVLSVWETSPTSIIQTYATQDGSWHRRFVNGSWTTWMIPNSGEVDARIADSAWQKAAVSNVDLNDYTAPGIYPMNLTGSTLNMPVQGPGSLEVFGNVTHISQRFTRWTMAMPQTWQRSRNNAGEWSDWSLQTLRHPLVGASDDFNSLVQDGYYPINSVNVANSPVSKLGVLWVVALGSLVFHEFTDSDGSVFFRLKNASGWGAWSPREVDVEQIKNEISDEINKSDRSPIAESQLVRSDVGQASYPASMSADRTIYFNGQSANGSASYSEDFGETWKVLKKFDGMFTFIEELGDGELIARVSGDPVNEIWRSSGWPTLREQCEWTKVLEAAAPGVYFSSSWGLSIYENIVLIAEYGAKYPYGNTEIGGNARYINLSLDYGKTFRRIFDLNEYATERGRDTANLHMHGVAWDPWWDRIWATCGDGGGAFIYSDDLGATWHTAHDGWAANAAGGNSHQSVGIVPMPDCVLFGTDSGPNGVLRIDRSEGKRLGEYPLEVAYVIDNDSGGLSHLAQRAYRMERAPGDYIAMFGFGTETVPGKTFAVATYDGFEFTKFWEDDQEVPLGRGLRTMIGPTLDGQVIIGSHDQRTPNRWGLWEGDFRGY